MMDPPQTTPFAYHTGRQVGRYTLMELVGSGGTAEVYKSIHPQLQRAVAIKILYPAYTQDTDFVNRFRQEAQTAAALVHPHIVQIYDFDVTRDGLYFIVMQYVDGPSLDSLLDTQTGPLTLEKSAAIFHQIASALTYAHEFDTIHRDLKPANVLLNGKDHAYLGDFGFAKLIGLDGNTRSSMTLGTPFYMAPEQIDKRPVTTVADVYGLGAILYQMLTNRLPYDGENILSVILKKIEEPPPRPTTFNPAIPAGIETVILKAMAIDPGQRYADVPAMVTAFNQALTGNDPETAVPAISSSAALKVKPKRRFPRQKWLWGIPLLLLIAWLLFFWREQAGSPAANGLLPATNTSIPAPVLAATAVTSPTITQTATPTATLTHTPSATPTATQTPSTTPSATATRTPRPTSTPTTSPTATTMPTRTPTNAPTNTPSPTAVPPTQTPVPVTATATSLPPPTQPPPTATPPPEPTRTPLPEPTRTPPSP